MCACDRKYTSGMSDFVVQKPMRTISLGFGSSKEDLLTDPNTLCFDILRNQAKTKDSCANTVQSLLRPAIKVCKQFGAKRSSDVPDQGQTSIPRVIIQSDFASDDHETFQTIQMHAMGDRGSRPPP